MGSVAGGSEQKEQAQLQTKDSLTLGEEEGSLIYTFFLKDSFYHFMKH